MGKRENEKRVEDEIREQELKKQMINETKGINYERKLKQKQIKAEEEAIEKRVEANKERILSYILKSSRAYLVT